MTAYLPLVLVVALFGTFMLALAAGQWTARGIKAPTNEEARAFARAKADHLGYQTNLR